MRRRLFSILVLLAAAAGGPAGAHAFLERAAPKVGSHAAAAPAEVRLTFSEPVEAALSTIRVAGPPGFGGAGAPAADGDGRVLSVPLHGQRPAGRYVVRWRAVSVDSHITQGQFSFDVGR